MAQKIAGTKRAIATARKLGAGVDWNDRSAVVEYAKRLGCGHVVYKHPGRFNYSIAHKEQTDLYQQEWVIHTTSQEDYAKRR